ncbi:MAG: 3-oxo-5-alpha-steroid 4-dehydrogenase, partial [Paludibacteraceae bacterium]|nr:3-oxo-5-alpha-steroid 4-dehydrogenase [Paludibacteraceae bacterium]
MALSTFYSFLFIMALIGLVVFVSLYFVDAGYGKMRTEKWGPAINNKIGWFLMEAPVFIVVLYLWFIAAFGADEDLHVVRQMPYLAFLLIFEFHYFQRSFVFPFLLKGESKMPVVIMFLSVLWNLINGYAQGWWLFHLA